MAMPLMISLWKMTKNKNNRHQRQQRHGEHLAIGRLAFAVDEQSQGQRHRVVLDVVQIDEGREEVLHTQMNEKIAAVARAGVDSGMMIAQ